MAKSTFVQWTEKERKNSSYLGRSGSGKCMGVEVFHTPGQFITIQPINSKDCLAVCVIQIPLTHVNKVCTEMQGNLLDMVLTNLKDQLPRLLGLDPALSRRDADPEAIRPSNPVWDAYNGACPEVPYL